LRKTDAKKPHKERRKEQPDGCFIDSSKTSTQSSDNNIFSSFKLTYNFVSNKNNTCADIKLK